MLQSRKGFLAVQVPEFKQIETEMKGGIALNASRIELISVGLVMDYVYNGLELKGGRDKIVIRSDAACQPWAKQVMRYDGKLFVFCPEDHLHAVHVQEDK
jgi:hypothetical protein